MCIFTLVKTKEKLLKMKKTLFVVILACIGLSLNAQTQPQNTGFENWQTTGTIGGEDPIGWSSFNGFWMYSVPVMSFKSLESHLGQYALRIISQTATIPPPFGQNVLDTVMGMVTVGSLDLNHPGIAYTDKPFSIGAFVKGTVQPTGSIFMLARLSKWNSNTKQRETLGEAVYAMQSSISEYTQIEVPFNYSQSGTPDTLVIQILTGEGGPTGHIMPGNELFIDDILLSGTVGVNEISKDMHLLVSPNPSTGLINIKSQLTISTVEITNLLGEKIYTKELNALESTIDLSKQRKGIYFYQIRADNGEVKAGKIVIE